jgi:hypothetical protein
MPGTGASLNSPDVPNLSVLESLEPGQLTEAKKHRLPRRRLKRSEMLLFWSLRLYLLFMIGVVIYQLWSITR